jgi:hypothetical protein
MDRIGKPIAESPGGTHVAPRVPGHRTGFLMAFALPCFVYLCAWRYLGSGDTVPAELLPISILTEGNFTFNEFVHDGDLPYYFIRNGQNVVSAYPVAAGVFSLPIYGAAYLFNVDLFRHRYDLALIAAAVMASGSVGFMFLALCHVTPTRRQALGFAYLYGFGTCVWSVASTGLWQHTPSLLWLTVGLWLLIAYDSPGLAGFAFGLAVASRPTNVLLAAPLLVVLARRRGASAVRFVLAMAVPLLTAVLYSRLVLGIWSLGQAFPSNGFNGSLKDGLLGLLISPSRGLFVFSPFTLAAIIGVVVTLRRRAGYRSVLLAASLGALTVLLLYGRWGMWWGGSSFGYRLILDLVPVWTLLTAAGWEFLSRTVAMRVTFACATAVSVYANALGSLVYPSNFNEGINLETARLWDWRESELVLCSRMILGLPPRASPRVPTVWWTPQNNDESIPGWLFGSPGSSPVQGELEVSGWTKSRMGDVDVIVILDDGTRVEPERFAFPPLAKVMPQLGDPSHAAFRATFPPPRQGAWRAAAVELRTANGHVRRLGPVRFWWEPKPS